MILFQETIPDGARDFIYERLGARVAAIYSCQEIGTIACECAAVPHYHVAAENALVEILDENGHEVAPGELGRVAVTGLYNYAMPFIRYDLGDLALAGEASCRCGRALPIITRIEGRTRSAFVFRDGARIWPRGAMVQRMHEFVPFRQGTSWCGSMHNELSFATFRMVQGATPTSLASTPTRGKVLHPSIQMSVREMEAFPSGPSGKVDEFSSHILTLETLHPEVQRRINGVLMPERERFPEDLPRLAAKITPLRTATADHADTCMRSGPTLGWRAPQPG